MTRDFIGSGTSGYGPRLAQALRVKIGEFADLTKRLAESGGTDEATVIAMTARALSASHQLIVGIYLHTHSQMMTGHEKKIAGLRMTEQEARDHANTCREEASLLEVLELLSMAYQASVEADIHPVAHALLRNRLPHGPGVRGPGS